MVIFEKSKVGCRRRDDRRKRSLAISHEPPMVRYIPSISSAEERIEDTIPPITELPISPMSPDPPHVSGTPVSVTQAWCGNEEILVGSVLNRPLDELYRFLHQHDLDNDVDLITELVLHFSLKIYGMPECPTEDLPLAVYMFIEDFFDIKSKIILCVELCEGEHSNVIGVLFETINMKYNVLRKASLLKDTEVRMIDNKDLEWIMDGLTTDCEF